MNEISLDQLRAALDIIGLAFGDEELERLRPRIQVHREFFTSLRERSLDVCTPPAVTFAPTRLVDIAPLPPMRGAPTPAVAATTPPEVHWSDIATLSAMVRAREISCTELAQVACDRLQKLDPTLHFVVTTLEADAMARAKDLDDELARGHWRGPLHGIPWGAKDIIAYEGAPTTWGTPPYDQQRFAYNATVVDRLNDAGAVLIAKLSTGQLAMGDVWFGGKTRNPWAPDQGSSGSSAGPASATAAGAVTFAIGSETVGSIVSPSSVCGCSSLRPTFGRVSRFGVMPLSWSFDKVGPMCRSVDDAALVFEAIHGPDRRDPSVVDHPFAAPRPVDVRGWRVGYIEDDDGTLPPGTLDELRDLGVVLVPWTPTKVSQRALMIASMAEQGCAFDELTRSPDLARIVTQDEGGWPDHFRASRLIPAVEYLRVQRERTEIVAAMERSMADIVAVVHASPTFPKAEGEKGGGGKMVSLSNFTGHPAVIAPSSLSDEGTPTSVTFTGPLLHDDVVLALASAWQRSTGHHHLHPAL